MTMNQVNNAIQQENARHNQATEALMAEQNDIERMKVQYDAEYKQTVNRLTEQYNNAYLEMQNAQGQKKLDLQADLNWIEWQKQNADALYKANISKVNEMNATTNRKQQEATEAYQNRMYELGLDKNEIEMALNSIKAKQVEYDKYYQDQQIRIQDLNFMLNKNKVDNEYSIGLIRAENEQVRNELEAQRNEMLEYKTAVDAASEVTHSIWEGVSTFINPFRRK